jgi:nucleoside-diphosphate-sugar epimerase
MKTFFKNKNILITGGSGIIGTELILKLVGLGANVRCVDFADLPEELAAAPIEFYKLDLSNPDAQFLFRYSPDYVFHLAADFERSTESYEFWDSNFKNNVLASRYTLEQIVKCESLKKIIFASSYLIYDKNLYSSPTTQVTYLNEDSPINPRNLCGVAKLQTEVDLRFLAEFKNFKVASARIFRVYGRGSRDVVSRWVRSALKGEAIEVFSSQNVFDYVYAGDVATGLLQLCQASTPDQVYNLGSGHPTKISEIISWLQANFPDLTINETTDEIFPEGSCADMSRFHGTTGWSAPTTILHGLQLLVDYEQEKIHD